MLAAPVLDFPSIQIHSELPFSLPGGSYARRGGRISRALRLGRFRRVALSGREPLVLFRERVHLVGAFTYEFRQPYHTAEKLPFDQAGPFLARSRSEARRLALRALRALQGDLAKSGHRLTRSALLLASGKPLPELKRVLASHALIHTADGELFREALLHASGRCGLVNVRIKEKELLPHAEEVLAIPKSTLVRRLTALGRPFGSPWSQDEKFAALAAWLALSANPTGP